MPDTLRDLVVSLSLNTDNFSRNIKSINSQIAEAESEFKRAAAGVNGFEKSVAGTQAKISSLTQKLSAQKNAVAQYERALEAANTKLANTHARQSKLTTALKDASTRNADLKTKVAAATKQYEAFARELGESDSATVAAKANLDALSQEYTESTAEVKKLDGQLAANTKSMQNSADAVTKARTNLNNARAAFKQTDGAIRTTTAHLATLESAWTKAGNSLTAFSKKAAATSKWMTTTGAAMNRGLTAPILALGVGAAKASISFESAFASVRKTVDATEEEYAQFASDIKKMSTEVATSTGSISEVMANAGQLGIQKGYLVEFTRTMIDLGNSTDIAAAEGAVSLAQFANVTGMAQSKFQNFGSALVDLGNNYATTESKILDMSTRLASAGTQVGLTEAEILGYATALSSVGLEAEAGGTAFSKAMIEMQVAVETGSKSLDDFAKVSGMSKEAFTSLWNTDPSAAITAFIVGLSQMDEQGISTIATLEEMGFSEVRLRDTLLRATNATELFAKAQETANSAWEENTALSEEAAKRYATTESKLKNLKNTAVLLGQQIGDDLNPTIQNLIDGANGLLEKFMALDESQRLQIIKYAGIAAAAGPVLSIFGKVTGAIGKVTGTLGTFMGAVGKAGGGWAGLVSVIGKSPSVWLALGAATVVATIALVDYITGAKAARKAIKEMNEQAEEWRNTQAKTIYDTGNDPFARFGIDKSDFSGTIDESKSWLDRLNATWTDGKAETTEIVNAYVDEFTAGSDSIREAIKARQKILENLGASDPKNDEYLKELDTYDKEVERLLKKRKNGFLTEDEQTRLDEIVIARAKIELEFTTGEGSGYDSIRKGVEAEKARLEAEASGESVQIGAGLYADALAAGAQGYKAQVDALNVSYREQYAAVAAITDEDQRKAALTELNTRHQESLNAARKEYNGLVSDYGVEAFQDEGVQKAKDDMQEFVDMIIKFNEGKIDETGLKEFTDTLDEGQLASYVALLGQLQESGLGDLDLGGGFTADQLLGGYTTVTEFLSAHKGEGFDALGELLGAAESEAMRVLVDLGLTEEGKTLKDALDDWENNGIKADVTVAITGYSQETGEAMTIQGININPVTGVVEGYDQKTGTVYSIGGVNINPETGEITGYNQATGEAMTISGVSINPETGTITGYNQVTGEAVTIGNVNINPETGTITGYNQATGEAITIGNVNINPETGDITAYNQRTGNPMKIQRVRLQGETGIITGYAEGPNVTKPEVQLIGTITAVKLAKSDYEKEPVSIAPDSWTFSAEEKVGVINDLAQGLKDLQEAGGDTSSGRLQILDQLANLTPEDLSGIASYASTLIEALSTDSLEPEAAAAAQETLNSIIAMLQTADEYLGVGNDISAGIAEGLTGYSWATDAATVATDIETALRDAAQSQSPARKYTPFGKDVSAGIGVGMGQYDFGSDATSVAQALENAVRAAVDVETMRTVGRNASLGLGLGILSGKAFVVAAIVAVARAAVLAAKRELKIESPSKVFRDEVGRMSTRGIGVGFELEAKAQARTIQNASRYLVGSAQVGVGGSYSYDNRKTYNYNAASAVQVDKLYVRDDQDIYSLAVEIASLTRRRQRGRGLRYA